MNLLYKGIKRLWIKTVDSWAPICYHSHCQVSAELSREKIESPTFGILFDIYSLFIHQQMSEGTIARLTDKGFGFISREGEEKDLFFHSNELVGVSFDELREGDKVTFEVADSPKGKNAVKVSKA